VTNRPELVLGYPLAILTPNVNEHKRLVGKLMGEAKGLPEDLPSQLRLLAEKMSGVTIVQKGQEDLISDGQSVIGSNYFGSPRRCGGQGDVLSGSAAVFMAWSRQSMQTTEGKRPNVSESISSNPAVVAALAGSLLLRKAAAHAFSKHKRSTLTTDIIESLGPFMEEFFPVRI
jgi:ATP-dependent NAD(P)H-hydrate dehydratase